MYVGLEDVVESGGCGGGRTEQYSVSSEFHGRPVGHSHPVVGRPVGSGRPVPGQKSGTG